MSETVKQSSAVTASPPKAESKPQKSAPKVEAKKSAEPKKKCSCTAVELADWLDETGASITRVNALREWIAEQDGSPTGDDAIEWMKTDPTTFQLGTLERAGKFVYGDGWHLQLPGESGQEAIERLNTVSTNYKKELDSSRAICSRLQIDNNDLRKEVARLEDDVRLLKIRLGSE